MSEPGSTERLYRTARTAVILWRTAPLLLSWRRDYRRWIRWGAPVQRTPAFHQERADRLVRTIADLGPAFVKLAQIFATRADLVPEPYLASLATLTDRVPPVPWRDIEAVLEDAYGAPVAQTFPGIDRTPLAAGSLGQVHRARVGDKDVVVKVLRPGVEAIVRRDAAVALSIVNRIYRRFPHHHVLGARVLLTEFSVRVEDEMDFRREGEQCERMRTRFLGERRLRIPTVESAYTRQRALVLEFLEGTRVDELADRVARGDVDTNALVETLIETYTRMMLRDGVFHADPHPGNLLVAPDGALVLLDFGMVIDVPREIRRALFETVLAAVRRDAARTADGFFALGLVAPGTSRDTMVALVDTLLEIAFADTSTTERAQLLADRVMRELLDWPIVLPGELVYFARTAALIEGVGARYDRNFNSIRVATPVVLRMRGEILRTLLDTKPGEERIVTWARGLGLLAGTAAGWLRRIGNPK